MRLVEFANAEEQLELWKLISTAVWNSIHYQVKQQEEQRQAELRAMKPMTKVGSNVDLPSTPPPKPLPKPKPLYPSKQKTATNKRTTGATAFPNIPKNQSIDSIPRQNGEAEASI